MLSCSSEPPHIVPPIAHVPRAMREAVNSVPLIGENSISASSVQTWEAHFQFHFRASWRCAKIIAGYVVWIQWNDRKEVVSAEGFHRRVDARQSDGCSSEDGLPSLPGTCDSQLTHLVHQRRALHSQLYRRSGQPADHPFRLPQSLQDVLPFHLLQRFRTPQRGSGVATLVLQFGQRHV